MKEYKLSKGWALFTYIAAPLLILLFIWVGFIPFLPGDDLQPGAAWFLVPMALCMVLAFCWMLMEAIRGKVLIGQGMIKQVSAFGTRELRKEEIKSFTVGENYITVFPLPRNKRKIRISVFFADKQEIIYWLASQVPDEDEMVREQETKDFDNDEKYGFTIQERQAALEKATTVNKYLSTVAGVAAIWAWAYPQPYIVPILISVIMPWVLIVFLRWHKGLIRFITPKGSLYPNASVVLLAPALALVWRAIYDYNILEYGRLWPPMVITGVVLVLALMVQDPGLPLRRLRSWGIMLLFTLFTVGYAYGSITLLNGYFDHSPPEVFTATVTNKTKSNSNSGTTYYLYLTPWGDRTDTERVDVPGQLYRGVELQDKVKITVKKGFFRIPWYYVEK